MNSSQRKIYDDILYKGRLECDSFLQGKSTRFNVLSSLLRLRQLCCHPKLLPDFEKQGLIDSTKTELLNELICQIIDSEHRTLVFSQFTSLLAIIRNCLNYFRITDSHQPCFNNFVFKRVTSGGNYMAYYKVFQQVISLQNKPMILTITAQI